MKRSYRSIMSGSPTRTALQADTQSKSPISRVDLHVHTCFSKNAGDWLLKSIGANESYTTPGQVYNIAKSRGMDFVTISDHDTIDGALEIAHYPGFFISEEVTAFFPEDDVKIHVVCLDIDEKQHRELQYLRRNVYYLVEYLSGSNILHFIAHPFFRMGKTLKFEHFEKMLLLFRVFEVRNGGKQLVPDNLLKKIINSLTAEEILRLAEKHGIEPVGGSPWQKVMVAGSDDHGGIAIGSPHTVCPKSFTKEELLNNIRNGNSDVKGRGGSMLSVAHQVMAVAYKFARDHQQSLPVIQSRLTWKILDSVFEKSRKSTFVPLAASAYFMLKSVFPDNPAPLNGDDNVLLNSIKRAAVKDKSLQQFIKGERVFDQKTDREFFRINSGIVNSCFTAIISQYKQSGSGIFEIVKLIKSAVSVMPLIAPYAVAGRTEYQDRHLMRQAANTFITNDKFYRGRMAVFVETSAENRAKKRLTGRFMDQVTILHKPFYFGLDVKAKSEKNFHDFRIAEYIPLNPETGQRLALPPVLDILSELVNNDYEMIRIQTLGSMAVTGTLLGRLLNIPVIARFPHRLVAKWLNSATDRNKAKILQYFIRYLYSQMQEIQVQNTIGYELLTSLQIDPKKIRIISARQTGIVTTNKYNSIDIY